MAFLAPLIEHASYTRRDVLILFDFLFYFFFFPKKKRIQLEKVRAEIVRHDGGRGRGRGRAQIRPVDGPGRGPVDRAADVPPAAGVLR